MYRPVLVSAPTETPVSLQELKQHLRLVSNDGVYTDEDGPLGIYLNAAVSHLDGYSGVLGRAIVTQTWRQDFDCWSRMMRLPMSAATIASVKYRASNGTLSTVDSGEYSLKADSLGSYVRFDDDFSFPGDLAESQAILIEFTAGFGAASAVPPAIKAAVMLLAAHLYANREATGPADAAEIPFSVSALIAPIRRVGV